MLLIILLSLYVDFNRTNQRKIYFLIIIFSLLAIISSIRADSVGVDTLQYVRAYKGIRFLDWNEFDALWYEWGFSALCKLLNYITENPQLLIFITSIFIMISVAIFIYKNSPDVVLSSFLFITLNQYFYYMNIMRQAIAIAIILFVYEFLKKDKYILYSCGVLLATLFHQSAVICLVFILFKKLKYTKKSMLLVFCSCIGGFLFWRELYNLFVGILNKYEDYINGIFGVSNYFGAVLEATVSLSILIVGLLLLLRKMEKNNRISCLAWIISAAVFSTILTIRVNIFNRVTPYFFIFTIIWIAEAIKSIKDPKERLLYKYFIGVATIAYCLIILYFRPEWTGVVPYRVFFL